MLEWIKHRDDNTCEVWHELYDHNIGRTVVTVHKDKQYVVQILDHVPYHSNTLKVAKASSQHIYEQICNDTVMVS